MPQDRGKIRRPEEMLQQKRFGPGIEPSFFWTIRVTPGSKPWLARRGQAVQTFLDAYKTERGNAVTRHLPFFVASECLHRGIS